MLIREKYLKEIRSFYDSDLVKILVGIKICNFRTNNTRNKNRT